LNKTLVIAGIAIVAVSKAIIIKSILVDQPAYERCLSSSPNPSIALCGTDPLIYFMISWMITEAGAMVLIYGLRANRNKILR